MQRVKVANFTISLDGYGAGPNQSVDNPLGVGGEALHDWIVATRSWLQMHGKEGGVEGVDDDFSARGIENIGAWILGRNMFGPVRGPWPDMTWKGWWGDKPPFDGSVFVLTHNPRPPIETENATTFHFVTEGIHQAMELARQAAGEKDVLIGGGADTIRQFLREGLIDELHIAIAPVLLGQGEPLFQNIDLLALDYELAEHTTSEAATHMIFDGLKRMYEAGETAIYYLTLENENYEMPPMPKGVEEGIIKGMYKFSSVSAKKGGPRVQLFGSGAILRPALDAQKLLAEKYGIASDVWSVTSYTQLAREADSCRRWNMLHPSESPRQSYVEQVLAGHDGPFIAASDYVRAVSEQIMPWVPGDYFVLGTDGMGRSETREALRRHFEVDAEFIVIATLYRLQAQGTIAARFVAQAIADLGVDPEKVNPLYA